MALACLCTSACKSGLPPYAEPLGDMARLEVDMNGSMLWKLSGGEMKGASASLEVRSKAIGGDLARFGAGGASVRGGESAAEVANDMVAPVVVEFHQA